MATGVNCAGVALKEHPVNLHHSIDALGIRPWTVFVAGFTAQDRVNPAISVGRHVVDDRLDLLVTQILLEPW